MNKLKPIKISVNEQEDELGFSRVDLKFKGEDVNHIITNSIKRIVQSDIPIFAFNNFDITLNTSIFNNNYIKNHIQNIPVWGIENNIEEYIEKKKEDIIPEEEYSETTGLVNDDIELSVDKNFDVSSINSLTMYVDFKNTTKDIAAVTTEHCKFYYKEGVIKSPYKNPVQIVKLQPGQEIKLSVKADLGTEEISSIYSATSVCFFKENKDDYDFIIESIGQITEKRILLLSLQILKKKLQKFNQNLPKNKGMEGVIIVDDEDHTLGNIISYGMQNHSAVRFCGYNTPHPLNKQIKFHYKLDSGNLNSVIKDVIVYYENIFDNIKDSITKLL
jgi:DNA-directed RNA polymerase subunit L